MAPFFGPAGASSSVSNPAPDDRQIAQRGQRFRAIGLSPGRNAGCWPCGVKGLGGSNPPLSAKQAAIYVILWRTPQPPIPPAAWQDSIGILHDQFHISANFAARFLSLVPGFGPPVPQPEITWCHAITNHRNKTMHANTLCHGAFGTWSGMELYPQLSGYRRVHTDGIQRVAGHTSHMR